MNARVSVLIPVYKNIQYLRDSLNSVLRQTYKNIEIIVISDGDPNFKRIKKIIQSYKKKIHLIKIIKNSGVSFALNKGLRKSKGKYINWLSHDDYFHEKKIEKQINFLKKNRKSICFTGCYLIDSNKKKNWKNFTK